MARGSGGEHLAAAEQRDPDAESACKVLASMARRRCEKSRFHAALHSPSTSSPDWQTTLRGKARSCEQRHEG